MAAKSLREALFKAFETEHQIVSEKLMKTLESEIRDYFAHEVMKYENRRGHGLYADGAMELFNHIFEGISAFKGDK